MLEKLQAVGEYIMIIKDESPSEKMGLNIPDFAKQKPNTGKIISVGSEVRDKKNVKKDRTAIFSSSAGIPIEIFDQVVTVLNQQQLLGVIC